MDLENDDVTPQVEDLQFEEEKNIETEKVSDKMKLMMEKTKKLQLKLEENSEPPLS